MSCDCTLPNDLTWRTQRFGLERSHSAMVQLTLDPIMPLLVREPSFWKALATKGVATSL
jgi:hypothetical protein